MKKLITLLLLTTFAFQSCKKANKPTTLTFKVEHLINLRTPYQDIKGTEEIRSAKYTIVVYEGSSNEIRTKRSDKIFDDSKQIDINANTGDRIEICIVLPNGFEQCDMARLLCLENGSLISSVNTDDALNTMTSTVK